MSIQLKEVFSGVRSLLGFPPHGKLPNHYVISRYEDKVAYYLTALNITNQNRFISRVPLTITPAKSEFPLDTAGTPFLALTVDDSDPFHVEREIEIVTIQDRDLYYSGPKQGLSTSTFPHVATSFAFFYDIDKGQRSIMVTPQHTETARYMIHLYPDTFTPPRLADNYPLMENFINLTKVDTALSLLPMLVEKDGNNETQLEWMEKRMTADMARYDAQWVVFKQMAFAEELGPRRGWATDGNDYCGW